MSKRDQKWMILQQIRQRSLQELAAVLRAQLEDVEATIAEIGRELDAWAQGEFREGER